MENTPNPFPRIVPRPWRMGALNGVWELDGEKILLQREEGTGVLLAIDCDGQMVNPFRVLSKGRKLERTEVRS